MVHTFESWMPLAAFLCERLPASNLEPQGIRFQILVPSFEITTYNAQRAFSGLFFAVSVIFSTHIC